MTKQKIAEFTEISEESQAHTYVVIPIYMAAEFSPSALTIYDEFKAWLISDPSCRESPWTNTYHHVDLGEKQKRS